MSYFWSWSIIELIFYLLKIYFVLYCIVLYMIHRQANCYVQDDSQEVLDENEKLLKR
jgi:hypothetical protein